MDEVAFNIGTGEATSVNRLADQMEAVSGTRPGREYRGTRAGELRHSTLDISRMKARGWSPHHALADGLRETYQYIAAERRSTDEATV